MIDDEPRCGACKFYQAPRCQRYPPLDIDWAIVGPDDWCGEYVKKLAPVFFEYP